MLTDRVKKEPPLDPDEWLTGTCATCKTVVRKQRWETMTHSSRGLQSNNRGDFLGRAVVECPKCKEVSLKKIGTTVYMVREPVQVVKEVE